MPASTSYTPPRTSTTASESGALPLSRRDAQTLPDIEKLAELFDLRVASLIYHQHHPGETECIITFHDESGNELSVSALSSTRVIAKQLALNAAPLAIRAWLANLEAVMTDANA